MTNLPYLSLSSPYYRYSYSVQYKTICTSASAYNARGPKKMWSGARVVNLKDFTKRARQEIAPQILSPKNIKKASFKSSYDTYKFSMKQWN